MVKFQISEHTSFSTDMNLWERSSFVYQNISYHFFKTNKSCMRREFDLLPMLICRFCHGGSMHFGQESCRSCLGKDSRSLLHTDGCVRMWECVRLLSQVLLLRVPVLGGSFSLVTWQLMNLYGVIHYNFLQPGQINTA